MSMPGLQIQPHSRHASTLAVALLSLLAAGSFVAGLERQLIGGRGPEPFPKGPSAFDAQVRAEAMVPEARPAPDMQLADAAPVRRAAKAEASPDPGAAPDIAAPAEAETPPSVDAAATVPNPEPPRPAPPADTEPPTS
jgi:hypothetical protein